MHSNIALEKYLQAQENTYLQALSEIKAGKKQSHWIWFIFPTIASRFAPTEYNIKYALQNKQEAIDYLNHPILGQRLIEITTELFKSPTTNIQDIFPKPDIKKIKACMTLFYKIAPEIDMFQKVIIKYYLAEFDQTTIQLVDNL